MVLTRAADTGSAPPKLSATAIVDRNVAARGGVQAWRAVRTMSLSGKLGAGGNQRSAMSMPNPSRRSVKQVVIPRPTEEVQLPFVMELKRPRKLRFELQFNGQNAIQVYDGANGWKLRPFLNRREVEPYTADELKVSSMQSDLDGPLVDYAAKGTKVELAGTEKVEGKDTYKLTLTMKNGQPLHVWIDAQTFLESKIEGQPRKLDGMMHPVEIYFRDYRAVSGLQIPFVLETRVLPLENAPVRLRETPVPAERTLIESVVINPVLDDSRFSKPEIGLAAKLR